MKNLFYLVIVLIGFSCKGSLSNREELRSVELGVINATPKQEKVTLEDLNVTIKSIRLETNDSCILKLLLSDKIQKTRYSMARTLILQCSSLPFCFLTPYPKSDGSGGAPEKPRKE